MEQNTSWKCDKCKQVKTGHNFHIIHENCGGQFCLTANKAPAAKDRIGGKWDNFGKLRLIHDDFTHDMMITLSGDFPNDEVAEKYLEKIKIKLNTE